MGKSGVRQTTAAVGQTFLLQSPRRVKLAALRFPNSNRSRAALKKLPA
jgi:hypothetical protein